MSVVVHGTFPSPEALERGRRAALEVGAVVEGVQRPVPQHDSGSSPVRHWVLVGGLLGFASGWALTIGTALAWPIRVGGKPIVSLPAFFIIAFELTILFAALAGLAGFLRSSRLPARLRRGYRSRAGVDRFDLRLRCDQEAVDRVRAAIESATGEVVEVYT